MYKHVKERIPMSNTMTNANETLQVLAEGDLSVLDTLVHMTEGTFEASGLDPESFMLVRLAALATLDAAPASWMVNIKVGGEAGLTPERIVGTLIAVAPMIGTARVVSAAGSIVRALGMAKTLAEDTSQ
jgi:4-carboxymuconolactone decarboxylase